MGGYVHALVCVLWLQGEVRSTSKYVAGRWGQMSINAF